MSDDLADVGCSDLQYYWGNSVRTSSFRRVDCVSSYERPGGVSCSTLSMTGFLRLIVTVYRTPVKIPFHTTA